MVEAVPMPLRRRWRVHLFAAAVVLAVVTAARAQDYNNGGDDDDEKDKPQFKAQEACNGAFLSYTFMERTKEYPHLKNATAQAYAFKAQATVLNTMTEDLTAWQMFVGFQHKEILVSVGGAVLLDGTDFPANVSGGATFAGYPMANLLNSIETAGDMTQIQVQIDITGTQFGIKPPGKPMPKTIKLANPGFRCPAPTHKDSVMYVCCVKDRKFKAKKANSTRYLPRQKADLTIAYDVLQAFGNKYMAQVTIDNWSPIGRLDNWNLTWEWKRGEFIENMRGAYTLLKEGPACVYSPAASYYKDFDFTPVYNCEKRPVIVDLPPEREKDNAVGNLPFCCKNGTLLPPTMDESKSRAMFQLTVYKLPPDLNRTALYPPQNWKIAGKLNPHYVCRQPIRVSPMEFPDPTGLMSTTPAVASWQVACNITRPKKRASKCCVSFSAYYNDSTVPCNTCACGCAGNDTAMCNQNAHPILLPSEAMLVPFDNRTAKARAWAKIKHWRVPNPMPCGDNCGLSINWHVMNNYKSGWSVRITIFNWQDYTFKDWFAAVTMGDHYSGYENVYSFNGTRMGKPFNNTIFMQGLPGLTYLEPITDGKTTDGPRVPGKQQSVISFKKKDAPNINIPRGEGFPKRVYFDGEECALPETIPRVSSARRRARPASLLQLVTGVAIIMIVAVVDSFCL
ncbi:COBRA-like protein 10 [Lolium perenne]|uniref:COBRA-like protein 10 n=1 Tax=Lolium perenne TaxID=4522 RepID=UPI0021EA5FD4|nr:COBRA-like protein 10 [Lolium perenne]